MHRGPWIRRTAGLALTLAAGFAMAAATSTKTVRGDLDPDSGDADGRFQMSIQERGDKAKEKLSVDASGLDAAKDGDGNRPTYSVFLIDSDDNAVDFGDMRLRRTGVAKLRFKSKKTALPEGVDGLEDFSDGTVEIRDGDTVVLSGDIPTVLGAGDDPERGDGATYSSRNSRKLKSDDEDSKARGVVFAEGTRRPKGDRDRIVVETVGAGRSGDVLTVVAIDDEDEETELGTLRVRGRLRTGVLKIDTRKGDDIPGGDLGDLEGQKVEVRDGDTVLLSGRFPTL